MRPRLHLLAVSLALFVSIGVTAFDANDVHVRYSVTSWTEKDGMPSSYIRDIAQDANGYLWLATYSGLVRFDGVRFVTWAARDRSPLVAQDLSAVLVARDGSLWIGGTGGVAHLVAGRVVAQPPSPDRPSISVTALLQDRTGTIWVAALGGLTKYDGAKWERVGEQYGLPARPVLSIFEDSHGVLFTGTSVGLFVRNEQGMFQQVAESLSYAIEDINLDPAGNLLITHPTSMVRDPNNPDSLEYAHGELSRSHGTRLLRDVEGNLWIGTRSQGLVRVRLPGGGNIPIVERITSQDGLSANSVSALFQDREGNVWAGTGFGLNRLSENRISPVPVSGDIVGYVRAVTGEKDGGVWAATDDELIHFSQNSEATYDWQKEFPARTIVALHSNPRTGVLWISTNKGLVHFESGRFSAQSLPPGLVLNRVTSVTTDSRNDLWLSDIDNGVYRSTDTTLSSFDHVTRPASLVFGDERGRVWLGFTDGTVGCYEDGKLTIFSSNDGLEGGAITAIYGDRTGTIWIGSHDGLSVFDGKRFRTLTKTRGFVGAGPVAIGDDVDGYLWLGVPGTGILRVDRQEFDRAVKDPSYRVRYRLFGVSDGLHANPVKWFGGPSVARDGRGRIWFLTGNGLAVVEPHQAKATAPPAPMMIEDVVADDVERDRADHLTLPPRVSKLQFDYTLLSLTPQSQVNFRYKLVGFDQDWVNAEGRRQAFYTKVPPGQYQFLVEASGGGLGKSAAVQALTIQPAFFETRWFRVSIALAVMLGFWLLWQVRLHQMRRRFALVLNERARLGREIHDTLLQGLVGVAMQFKVIGELVESAPEVAKQRLDDVRHLVQHCISDTRQSIWALRSPLLELDDLATALKKTGDAITSGSGVKFELTMIGTPYLCSPKVEEQLLRIGREALTNAMLHANPKRIQLELSYGKEGIRLRVIDDGSGFSVPVNEDVSGSHWGLMNMRERAQQVNGQLHLASAPGKGTELEFIVPALNAK